MKYEEIKIGDVFLWEGSEEIVITKSDKYKIITTIDSNKIPTTWLENDLHLLKPIKEQLPEEGLLAAENGALVYRTGETSGYGFETDEDYNDTIHWSFISNSTYWQPATPEQEEEFIEMLKKECEKYGLNKDTNIEYHAEASLPRGPLNKELFGWVTSCKELWNKNGCIFYKGKFATPRKEEPTLIKVTKAVQEIGNFTIEQTESGVIILTKIKK